MPPRKPRKQYTAMKKNLRKRGIGPLYRKAGDSKLKLLRGPSIPAMYPYLRGKAVSRYRRKGVPILEKKALLPRQQQELVRLQQRLEWLQGAFHLAYARGEKERIRKEIVQVEQRHAELQQQSIESIRFSLVRASRKAGGGGAGGGSERLGKGGHRMGTAAARKAHAARVGGTRGAKPHREKKKKKKK